MRKKDEVKKAVAKPAIKPKKGNHIILDKDTKIMVGAGSIAIQDGVLHNATTLSLNTKYLFSNDDNEFIAEIKSFDPLVVWEWSIVGGCQSSTELSIESLDEYTITDDKDEVFRRLA
jgi:hypothetical protein